MRPTYSQIFMYVFFNFLVWNVPLIVYKNEYNLYFTLVNWTDVKIDTDCENIWKWVMRIFLIILSLSLSLFLNRYFFILFFLNKTGEGILYMKFFLCNKENNISYPAFVNIIFVSTRKVFISTFSDLLNGINYIISFSNNSQYANTMPYAIRYPECQLTNAKKTHLIIVWSMT